MPSGLIALLDDVATIAKIAAASVDDIGAAVGKAGTKAAGVVIDDTAVTPRYVTGFSASRELPIVGKIALGSLKNKVLFGSDFPVITPERWVKDFEGIAIKDENRPKIMKENAAALFGLRA